MKDDYDFTNAEQGKFYRPIKELDIPIYLDDNSIYKFEKSGILKGLDQLENRNIYSFDELLEELHK